MIDMDSKIYNYVKKNKPSKKNTTTKLDEFKKEFNNQYPLIIKKIELSSGNNKERLLEFKKDVEKLKKMSDDSEKILKSKGIRNKFKQTRFIMISSNKYMIFVLKMIKKYKKEDCNIENFEI